MSRQNSMSYPGQGRVKEPPCQKTLMEVAKGRERPRSQNPIGTPKSKSATKRRSKGAGTRQ